MAWALFLALGAYAFTGNVLIMPAGILPFLYRAVMRTPSARRARHWSRHRTSRAGAAAEPAAAP